MSLRILHAVFTFVIGCMALMAYRQSFVMKRRLTLHDNTLNYARERIGLCVNTLTNVQTRLDELGTAGSPDVEELKKSVEILSERQTELDECWDRSRSGGS